MPRTASWHHWPQDHTKAISTDLSFFFFLLNRYLAFSTSKVARASWIFGSSIKYTDD
jgi:hypothetical protein